MRNFRSQGFIRYSSLLTRRKNTRKRDNQIVRGVGLLIAAVGIGVLAYPSLVGVFSKQAPAVTAETLPGQTMQASDAAENGLPKDVPSDSRIVIPKIGVDMEIVEGTDEKASLNLGAWRMPMTSTPEKGSNTVITGHRFKYRPPSPRTFWRLDELVEGDQILVYWNGEEYEYTVNETKVVEPSAVEVLYPTEEPIVTLITCTPLFTTKQRLIVTGKQVQTL